MRTVKKGNIVIWGAGGHAAVVAHIIRIRRQWNILGFIDDINPERQDCQFCGSRVLKPKAFDHLLDRYGSCHAVIAIGECEARLRLAGLAEARGFRLATIIHPAAVIAPDVRLGAGSVVVAGALINPECVVGENVIINTRASVDHHCSIEDGAHICPGVTLGGGVNVGRASWIGIGSTVVDKVRIGAGCLIGAASLVLKDVPDGVVAYGSPAKIVRRKA